MLYRFFSNLKKQEQQKKKEVFFDKNTSVKRLFAGVLDNNIFTKPELTPELKFIRDTCNHELVMRIFAFCKSEDVLKFWMAEHVKLPQYPIGLAIGVKGKKTVFEYLGHIDNGRLFKELDDDTSIEYMQFAREKLDQSAMNCLIELLNRYQTPQRHTIS